MKVRLLGGVVLGFYATFASVPVVAQAADDGGSKLMITAPVNSAAVDGRVVKPKQALTKGAKAHRVCVYLDGRYQKDFKGPFTNRPGGTQEINVAAATTPRPWLLRRASRWK